GGQKRDKAGPIGRGADRLGGGEQRRSAIARLETGQRRRHRRGQEVSGARAVVFTDDRREELPGLGVGWRRAERLQQEGEGVVEGAALPAKLVEMVSLAE